MNWAALQREESSRRLSSVLAVALLLGAGCDDSASHGALVVAISTDMAMPQQIDNLYVQVQMRGLTVFDNMYAVGSGTQDSMIPATLSLVSGERRDAVTIRVSGQKRGRWRTYREATTTVPTDRSALLRMPVQWLCDDSVKAVTYRDANGVTQIKMLSACEDGNTCVAGTCRPSLIDNRDLPNFKPQQVFGGSTKPEDGQCFDTIPCMAAGNVVEPDADCTVQKPDGDNVNVALRVTDDGICDATTGTICFVPLDRDKVEGWRPAEDEGRLQLPEAVCEKLKTRLVNAVYVSTECPTKDASIPPCGPWSSVAGGKGLNGDTTGIASTDPTQPDVPYPTAKLVATVIREGMPAQICCPLMADAGKFYTCLCTSQTNATLVNVDIPTSAITIVGSLNPPSGRESLRFPAEVSQDALYWASDQEIQRTPILGTGGLAARFPVGGAVYESTTLLASDGRIYALATGVANAMGAPVQLVALEPDEPVTTFDTGGTQPVFQFAQDDDAIYLAVDVDEPGDDGHTRRTSSVIRLAKADGARTTIIPEQVLDLDDPLRGGGFTGVQVDGSSLFALFESMPAADGTLTIQVQQVDLTEPNTQKLAYETTADRNISQLSMLGAVDGAIVLSRVEYETDDDKRAVRSSSIIAVPEAGTGPRFIADYSKDYPGNDLVSDDDQIYWLNSSGRLYGFPRTALR